MLRTKGKSSSGISAGGRCGRAWNTARPLAVGNDSSPFPSPSTYRIGFRAGPSSRATGHCTGPPRSRSYDAPRRSHPVFGFHARLISSKICSALSYENPSSYPMARATAAMIRQSALASPGGSTTGRARVSVRSLLTRTPSASVHSAPGSTTSAYALVSVSAKTSWVTTNSAASSPSMTVRRLATEATGLVQMIQQAFMSPSAIFRNISTVPCPTPSLRMLPPGSTHSSSTKARSSSTSTDRCPGSPGPMYPISRPPMALGCPVRENGPLPGRQMAPVARCRLTSALVFQVPCVDWFRPMVQQLVHSPASPISRAAVRMSSSGMPVISATAAGG